MLLVLTLLQSLISSLEHQRQGRSQALLSSTYSYHKRPTRKERAQAVLQCGSAVAVCKHKRKARKQQGAASLLLPGSRFQLLVLLAPGPEPQAAHPACKCAAWGAAKAAASVVDLASIAVHELLLRRLLGLCAADTECKPMTSSRPAVKTT